MPALSFSCQHEHGKYSHAHTHTRKCSHKHITVIVQSSTPEAKAFDGDAIRIGYYQSFRDIQSDCITNTAQNLVCFFFLLCSISSGYEFKFFKRKNSEIFQSKSHSCTNLAEIVGKSICLTEFKLVFIQKVLIHCSFCSLNFLYTKNKWKIGLFKCFEMKRIENFIEHC